jgi:hypothetical protein
MFEFLIAGVAEDSIFLGFAAVYWMNYSWRFEGSWYRHLQGSTSPIGLRSYPRQLESSTTDYSWFLLKSRAGLHAEMDVDVTHVLS